MYFSTRDIVRSASPDFLNISSTLSTTTAGSPASRFTPQVLPEGESPGAK